MRWNLKKKRCRTLLFLVTALSLVHLACGVKISPDEVRIITSGPAPTPTPTPPDEADTAPPTTEPTAVPPSSYDVIEAAVDAITLPALPGAPPAELAPPFIEAQPPPITSFEQVTIVGVVDKNTVDVLVDDVPYRLPYVALPPQPPASPQQPYEWDSRLNDLGITLTPAQRQPGRPVYRLVKALYQDENESGGLHHIFVEVLDENGRRILDQPVIQSWDDGQVTLITEDKPYPEYAANVPMYSAIGNGEYRIYVDGYPSDVVGGLGLPASHLVNYLLTFQRKSY